MRINPVYIIRLLACEFIALMLALVLRGCKTCECLPSIEYRDSIITRYRHDTIQTYEKDSIFIHAKGDTIEEYRSYRGLSLPLRYAYAETYRIITDSEADRLAVQRDEARSKENEKSE